MFKKTGLIIYSIINYRLKGVIKVFICLHFGSLFNIWIKVKNVHSQITCNKIVKYINYTICIKIVPTLTVTYTIDLRILEGQSSLFSLLFLENIIDDPRIINKNVSFSTFPHGAELSNMHLE
jgi:ABC-type uncharacterized transport system permease subunit